MLKQCSREKTAQPMGLTEATVRAIMRHALTLAVQVGEGPLDGLGPMRHRRSDLQYGARLPVAPGPRPRPALMPGPAADARRTLPSATSRFR